MPAFEWKLNQIINKDKNLIKKFPQNWRHPINIKFNCYRNNIFEKNMFIIHCRERHFHVFLLYK